MTRTLLTAAVGALALLAPRPAAACGGCFAPTDSPTVVTAHRMAVSVGTMSTVLWDQFEYAGSPEDFVWVLPVAGGDDVTVELADNAFFLALQQNTAVQLTGPLRPVGGGGGFGGGGGGGGGFGCASADAASFAADGGAAGMGGPRRPPVQVFHEGTVGPYETVVIGSEDPMALREWLADRGYSVPEEMLPTIEYYVEHGMDFVALRLAPGESVNRMQPVRVTTRGMNVSFPLRMVAAGVVDFVALELYVIGEGRYEAANFPNGMVDRGDIVFDWASNEYNYDELAQAVVEREASRTWLTEFADVVDDAAMRNFRVTDDGGGVHTAVADWSVAVRSVERPTITRMRANLPVQALSNDLILAASLEDPLPGFVQVERDINFGTASIEGVLTDSETRMASLPLWPFAVLGLLVAGVTRRRRRGA